MKHELNIDINYEQMFAMISSIRDGVIATDTKGLITYMNPSAEGFIGWSSYEALGKEISEIFKLVNAVTNEVLDNPVKLVIKTGNATGLQKHSAIYDRNGELYYVSASCSPIINEGKITGVVVVFRDITRIKRIEEAVLTERNNFKSYFDASLIGKLIINQSFEIKHINPAYLKDINKAYNEVLGKSIGEVFNCNQAYETKCGNKVVCICDYIKEVEQVFTTKKAHIGKIIKKETNQHGVLVKNWYKVDFIPTDIDQEPNVMINIEDITNQKEIEEALISRNNLYLRMFENFPTLIWKADIKGRAYYNKNRWTKLMGLPLVDSISDWIMYIHPEDQRKY